MVAIDIIDLYPNKFSLSRGGVMDRGRPSKVFFETYSSE